MGFSVHYESTTPLSPETLLAVTSDAAQLTKGHTWLSCEPLLLEDRGDGRLSGGSKPTFVPDPRDVASAMNEGLPDGSIKDVIAILCELSRRHGVDWEIVHDYADDGPTGHIRDGVADREVLEFIDGIAEFAALVGEFEGGGDFDFDDPGADEDDDDGPDVLQFRPR